LPQLDNGSTIFVALYLKYFFFASQYRKLLDGFPQIEGRKYLVTLKWIALFCKMIPNSLKKMATAVLCFAIHSMSWAQKDFSKGFEHSTEGIEFAQSIVKKLSFREQLAQTLMVPAWSRENRADEMFDSVQFNKRFPLHLQTAYQQVVNLPISEDLCKSVLSLPICPELDVEQQDYIINNIQNFIQKSQ